MKKKFSINTLIPILSFLILPALTPNSLIFYFIF